MDVTVGDDFVRATMRHELRSLERQRSLLCCRVSNLNKLLSDKCAQVETYKKALDQERLLKESTIGKLTRLKHCGDFSSWDSGNFEQNPEYQRRKLKEELELVDEELHKIFGYQKILNELGQKVQDKDRRLTAAQEEIRQLEIKIDAQERTKSKLMTNLTDDIPYIDQSSAAETETEKGYTELPKASSNKTGSSLFSYRYSFL